MVSGVEVTGTGRGCSSRLLLLLGAVVVVGTGSRLAGAGSGTWGSFVFLGTEKAWPGSAVV